jgi:heme/copper-type cytochrome/quinol oxidase subunit 2
MIKNMQSTLAGGGWKWAVFAVLALAILLIPLPAQWPAPHVLGGAAPVDRLIKIHASSFEYNPGTIRVNPGDRVTLELSSTDVTHGIYLDGYNIAVTAEPGQSQSLSFTADRPGAFRLRCSVTCGALHPFMIGKLQVGPNALLWKSIAIAALGLAVMIWRVRK